MLRIRGEQTMQQSCTTARQPYNKERFADFLTRDLGIKLPVSFYQQARTQRVQHVEPKSDLADQIQLRLGLAGFEQTRQRLKKIVFAEVIGAAALLCSLYQINRSDSARWNSRFSQQTAASV